MDTTITLGNIIAIIVFIAGMLASHRANAIKFARMEFKVDLMWKEFKKRFDMGENNGD